MTQMAEIEKEYGEALFTLGLETDKLEEISQGLSLIEKVFESTPEYAELLSSPSVSKKERLDSIEATFSQDVPEYVLSFLCVLCEHGRIARFSECTEIFQQLYREKNKVSEAKVTSAVPLTDEQREQLKVKLENKVGHTVELICSVDNTLLGGMKVELDGLCFDGSLSHRLKTIKEVMGK